MENEIDVPWSELVGQTVWVTAIGYPSRVRMLVEYVDGPMRSTGAVKLQGRQVRADGRPMRNRRSIQRVITPTSGKVTR